MKSRCLLVLSLILTASFAVAQLDTIRSFKGDSRLIIIADLDCKIELKTLSSVYPQLSLNEAEEVTIQLPANIYTVTARSASGILVTQSIKVDLEKDEMEVIVVKLYEKQRSKEVLEQHKKNVADFELRRAKYDIFVRQGDELLAQGDQTGAIQKYEAAKGLGIDNAAMEKKIARAGGEVTIKHGRFKDHGDGRVYGTVQIGTQVWMAENLRYYSEGAYLFAPERYGYHYTWSAAMRACPEGWHLPSNEEWELLLEYLGEKPGKKLKSISDWKASEDWEVQATDDFGWGAMPAGWSNPEEGTFNSINEYAGFWTATQTRSDQAIYRAIHYESNGVGKDTESKALGLSVRCVKD